MSINQNSVLNRANSSQSVGFSALSVQKKIRKIFKKKCERILLIQPLFFPEEQFDFRIAKNKRYYNYPPYGLGLLTANLKKSNYKIHILDLNMELLRFIQNLADDDKLIPKISYQLLLEDAQKLNQEIIGKTTEFEGITSQNKPVPLEVTISEMKIGSNPIFNMVLRDTTERHLLEDQLRHAQKLESIGQLAAGIAHEINTPVQYVSDNISFIRKVFTGILNVLENSKIVMETQTDETLEDLKKAIKKAKLPFVTSEIPKALDQSIDGLERIATIVRAMKSFSHSSGDQMKETDIKEAIETTVTVARSEWKYVADVTCDFEDNLPLVYCLRDEFNQVVLNILVNAAHAIEDAINANQKDKGEIKLSVNKEDNCIAVTIADNGNGIPKEIQDKIFDPFFTTKEIGKGTGQGLSIAYNVIVEKHNGSIHVASEEGKGTTFKIKLPLTDNNET